MLFCLNLSYIDIITEKGAGYCCVIYNITKSEATHLFVNSVLEHRGYIKNSYQRNQY